MVVRGWCGVWFRGGVSVTCRVEFAADILFVPAEILLEFDANIIFTGARAAGLAAGALDRPHHPFFLYVLEANDGNTCADLSEP